MLPLLIKLIATPLLMATTTLVGRRWGASVGGVLAALPVVTGSVSLVVAVEHGPAFAARTASAALVGLAAVAWFCLAYAHASGRLGWPRSLLAGYLAFGLGSLAIVPLGGLSGAVCLAFVTATLVVVLRLMPAASPGPRPTVPGWDIPARMATATVLVVGITALAGRLGPAWSGLLAAFPVLFAVLLVFTDRNEGRQRALGVLRGFLTGLVATSLFLAIVADGIAPLGTGVAFGTAAAVCLAYQAAAMTFHRRRSEDPQPAGGELRPFDAPLT